MTLVFAALLVLLDPGHDPSSPGATSARGRPEFQLNEEVARVLSTALETVPGIRIERTRRADEVLAPRDRGLRANERRADLLLSIHHDDVEDVFKHDWDDRGTRRQSSEVTHGFSLHVRGDDPRAVAVAKAIGEELVQAGFVPTGWHERDYVLLDRAHGIYDRRHLAMLNAATVPTVLLECGFISHREEEAELETDAVRARLAGAVAKALARLPAILREKR